MTPGRTPTAEALIALAGEVQAACVSRGLTLATAESCTGGLVSHVLTEVPGSSAYFLGGVVSYSDQAKSALLGVPETTLRRYGAVSAQAARAMAIGARAMLRTDLALAVTGIAGPAGGTPDKPVGLTFIALAAPRGGRLERHVWSGGRPANKRASAQAALRLVLAWLDATPGTAA
ncbi:MAG TPA: CinA family protein [Candidatus Sulfotelmatobacter sp.]|nr:CinA family protein [Candidatus Sulfotelmatobacter sp.]